ncbi:MAG: glycosyltransferase family 4 protein [Spirulina sp.]
MKFFFLHQNFPAQIRHLATLLGQDPNYEIVFGTTRPEGSIPGVKKAIYQPSRQANPDTHHYVHNLENAVLEGQGVYRVAKQLKQDGFYPHIVYAHSGWGPGLFIKDIFPKAQYVGYFEWFYHARGSDADFDPKDPLDADAEARIRVKNAPLLLDLYSCDKGLCPTYWQRQQFPPEFHGKLAVGHDGVDLEFFRPQPEAKLVLDCPAPIAIAGNEKTKTLDLSNVKEIITYVGRGMEPYRGFPQFMEAAALIQQRRPEAHIVVVGEDRVAYGKKLPNGQTYRQAMLAKLDLDLSRIHFTGRLPYPLYLQVLQASSVHIYLTRPFVLSWSMLEAMAVGCVVVGSKTPPVEEVIRDGVNGFLVDFFSPEEVAGKVEMVLDNLQDLQDLRMRARNTILARYNLQQLLPLHLMWLLGDRLPFFIPTSF